MSNTPTFYVRGLEDEDSQFIVDSFNASLPHLASIGSGGQWGSEPFAERANAEQRIKIYEQAKRYQSTGEGDPILVFIIEVAFPPEAAAELPASIHIRTSEFGDQYLAVGTMMLSEGIYPPYIGQTFHKEPIKKALDGTSDYVYLEALITDFRTGLWRKGAGAALIEYSRKFCLERGKQTIYVDCYAGNDGKLVKYYENQGFTIVDSFEGPKPDGTIWHGMVLRMDIKE
ncbi:hypothetical protein ONZ43_g1724 [Nemania bipapillata]|uniref:Uncharacterized protein n=1 Tax=Nemania bipapillata TaxID=110536 RepID=A0ACC2J3C7_9PEZI|nr:hypothetical protein ONZ43_g1724 [Nemania bipapillata]